MGGLCLRLIDLLQALTFSIDVIRLKGMSLVASRIENEKGQRARTASMGLVEVLGKVSQSALALDQQDAIS